MKLLTEALIEQETLVSALADVLSDNPAVNFSIDGPELLVESRAPKPHAAGVPPEFRMASNSNIPFFTADNHRVCHVPSCDTNSSY